MIDEKELKKASHDQLYQMHSIIRREIFDRKEAIRDNIRVNKAKYRLTCKVIADRYSDDFKRINRFNAHKISSLTVSPWDYNLDTLEDVLATIIKLGAKNK